MSYTLWQSERVSPTEEARRSDRPTDPRELSGFWRIQGARTKPDWPVAIWTAEGQTETVFQIGRKKMNTAENATDWEEFIAGSWLKCVAVTKADWSAALETGRWPDDKPARNFTPEEKADIIPTTPASEGGNAPVDEEGKPLDDFFEQIKAKLAAAAKRAEKLGAIDSLDAANAAAAIVEDIATVGKLGEQRRKEEKAPFDRGAAAVQEKWVPILEPASKLATQLKQLIQRFKDAEEARLRREAREAQERETARLAEENRQRLEEEARQRAAETGEPEADPAAIAHQAELEAAEQVAAMPQAETTVRVGTATGRGVSVAKRKVGVITDVDKFIAAIRDQQDFRDWLQEKADRLARAKTKLDGMEIESK